MEDGLSGKMVVSAAIVVEEVKCSKPGVVPTLYISVEALNVWELATEQCHVMSSAVQVCDTEPYLLNPYIYGDVNGPGLIMFTILPFNCLSSVQKSSLLCSKFAFMI